MKKILLLTALLSCFALRSIAADATIANAPGGSITTVPNSYVMPWEDPAVQGYDITLLNLTNQILQGMASTNYAVTAATNAAYRATNGMTSGVSLAGTNTWTGTNVFTVPIQGSITGNAATATSATNVIGGNVTSVNITNSGVFIGHAIAIPFAGVDFTSAKGYFSDSILANSRFAIYSASAFQGGIDCPSSGLVRALNSAVNGPGNFIAANGTFTGFLIVTNGVINYGTGWAGTTNATAPVNAVTPVAWLNYTNTTGGVFKMPLYQ